MNEKQAKRLRRKMRETTKKVAAERPDMLHLNPAIYRALMRQAGGRGRLTRGA
jgi:hypothetical protein